MAGISDRPPILSYCATFLREEAWHIYRQITGVRKFRNIVVCRRRENATTFPHEDVLRLDTPFYRGVWRMAHRAFGRRVPLTPAETGQLLRIRAQKQARLVHVYLGTEALRALPYLERETCTKIVSFHGADLADSVRSSDVARLSACTDVFLCRCRALAEILQERGCPAGKIRLHYTGVPVPGAPAERTPPREDEPIRLLQASRFIEKKGLDLSLRALRLLLDRGRPATLVLAGSGPETDRLHALARELNLQDHVFFTGFISQSAVNAEMRLAHVFLHPSRVPESGDREGIPNSLLEAMAVGTPVVATSHSGIPEAVTNGWDGFLVKENPESIANGVLSLAEDPHIWSVLSGQAQEKVRNRFSLSANRDTLEALYTELVS